MKRATSPPHGVGSCHSNEQSPTEDFARRPYGMAAFAPSAAIRQQCPPQSSHLVCPWKSPRTRPSKPPSCPHGMARIIPRLSTPPAPRAKNAPWRCLRTDALRRESRHAAAGGMVFATALALARGRVDLCAGRPARAGNRCWSHAAQARPLRRLSSRRRQRPPPAQRNDRPVVYLEVGSRRPDDDVEYSDIDMRRIGRTGDPFRHKDGTPYG